MVYEYSKHLANQSILANKSARFLLARLHVESLFGYTTKKMILSKLDTFKRGVAELDQAYCDALDRIDGQLDGYRELARRALSWISYARRLLTTEELLHALAMEPGENSLDPDNVDEIEEVISLCAVLVTVDMESSIVRLVYTRHRSTSSGCD
jgi:hypothetical protein